MKRTLLALLVLAPALRAATSPSTSASLQLPAFPLPAFVQEDGAPKEMSPVRLLRELFRGGVHVSDQFETVDQDYGLLRRKSVEHFAAWLEAACQGLGVDLLKMRSRIYDAGTFSRLLEVSASLAALEGKNVRSLAVPIGLLVCKRDTAWGELKRDGTIDAYILFATEEGMLVYDPPTRQLANLADFPNKDGILRIRF